LVEYQSKNRAKFLIMYHFIFVVKYRKSLLIPLGERIKSIFHGIAGKSDFNIKEIEVEMDHVHVLVSSIPRLSPSQIVRCLKALSTRCIWNEHPEFAQEFWSKRTFWSDGYFRASIGNASIETIREYIENQG
jgi:putative transposase